ncbi:hypothetical protein [Acidisphaera rubrifaciens]|uniref:Secreted protein n=1 Tax=Acidisphaera rubrifaciens HS-AP3 TaxID=1231350 RepID=A0A0D6PAB1_9PROT|nr:hypothetical protein [Acidisphaera rubrifaciens]GAN78301.1 hypothetical protein Asru_0736_02 [Acidisphaera rubrifaciens HS-AP3]
MVYLIIIIIGMNGTAAAVDHVPFADAAACAHAQAAITTPYTHTVCVPERSPTP